MRRPVTPHATRHAGTSLAAWAGHSVAVLLRVYAKCIDGQDQVAKRRIKDALREPDDPITGPKPGVTEDNGNDTN